MIYLAYNFFYKEKKSWGTLLNKIEDGNDDDDHRESNLYI